MFDQKIEIAELCKSCAKECIVSISARAFQRVFSCKIWLFPFSSFQPFLFIGGFDSSALCRSRRELSNEYLLAKFGFDTAENEPFKVCPLFTYRSPRYSRMAEMHAARGEGSKLRGAFRTSDSGPAFFPAAAGVAVPSLCEERP